MPARTGTAVAWTGREVLVVGGAFATGSGVSLDAAREGAAYDPAADTWRELAPFPLAPRRAAAAAWTGRELVVWGGVGRAGVLADGAAYDPAADTWRELAPSPLSPRGGAGAVWTGTEVLVLGGGDLAAGLADGAAYDPAADTWRPVPAAPRAPGPPVGGVLAEGSVRLAWTGDRAVVVPPAAPFTDSAAGLLAYAPAAGAWSSSPFGPVVQVLAVGAPARTCPLWCSTTRSATACCAASRPTARPGPASPTGRDEARSVARRRGRGAAVAGRGGRDGGGGGGLRPGPRHLGADPDRPVVAGEDAGTGPGPFQLEGRHVTWTGDELVLLAGRSPGLLRVHRWRPVLSPDERAGLVPEGTALGLRRWFYETTGGTAPPPDGPAARSRLLADGPAGPGVVPGHQRQPHHQPAREHPDGVGSRSDPQDGRQVGDLEPRADQPPRPTRGAPGRQGGDGQRVPGVGGGGDDRRAQQPGPRTGAGRRDRSTAHATAASPAGTTTRQSSPSR